MRTEVPVGVPVNLRAEGDPAGGNRFGGVNLAAPVGEPDPVARIETIHAQMAQVRDEPALGLMGSVAPVLSILPTPVLMEMMLGSAAAADVLASNVPFYPGDTYIAGAKILRQYGFAPLNGVAMDVVLISRGGLCTVTARYDRAAVLHDKLFAQCLQEGFDEILALAGDPPPHAVPVSLSGEASHSSSQSASDS